MGVAMTSSPLHSSSSKKLSSDELTIEELNAVFTDAVARLYRRIRADKANEVISDSYRSVLKLLVSSGPHTLRELSDHEHVTPPSMNQTVNGLEQLGLLIRKSHPTDGRKVMLVATSEGVTLIDETRRRRHEWLSVKLEELTDGERRTLKAASEIVVRIATS